MTTCTSTPSSAFSHTTSDIFTFVALSFLYSSGPFSVGCINTVIPPIIVKLIWHVPGNPTTFSTPQRHLTMLLVRSFASFAAHIEQHAAHLFIFPCNPAASFWITLGSAHSFTGCGRGPRRYHDLRNGSMIPIWPSLTLRLAHLKIDGRRRSTIDIFCESGEPVNHL